MQKMNVMVLALIGLAAGISAHEAEIAAAPQACTANTCEHSALQLSAEEQNFANGLSDLNKSAFSEILNADQRKAAMRLSASQSHAGVQRSAEKKTLTPNEAVQKVMADNHVVMEEAEELVLQSSEDAE